MIVFRNNATVDDIQIKECVQTVLHTLYDALPEKAKTYDVMDYVLHEAIDELRGCKVIISSQHHKGR